MLIRSLLVFVCCAFTHWAMADQSADKFWAKQNKEALRELERGDPLKQIKAVGRLGSDFAEQTAPVLVKYLAHADPSVRLAAAEEAWERVSDKAEAFASLNPALRVALEDDDAAISMNAAGALAAMGVAESELAPARRRVLTRGVRGYVGFLAARGLVGIDPAPALLPYLLEYYFDAVEAQAQGGSRDNMELGEKALAKLVASKDRELILPLRAALEITPPATPYLLRMLGEFTPPPDGFTDILLRLADNPYPETRETAWKLIGKQRDTVSLARWVPKAARLLADTKMRKVALWVMDDAAGLSAAGLPELAALANDASAEEADRVRAIEILVDGADRSNREGQAKVQAEARKHWEAVCAPILKSHAPDAYFEACQEDSSSILPDEAERARLLGDWLAANEHAEAKVVFLGRLESMWAKAMPAASVIHAQRKHADARVVQAAESALNRVEPAWRERGARSSAGAASVGGSKTATPGAKSGADGAALYAAIAKGDLAAVKRLVNAGNVHAPVRYPQMQGTPPIPIVIAVNYCGIPQAAGGLKAIVEYLLGLGANPDAITLDGSRLLDQAKYACPPEVMAALTR